MINNINKFNNPASLNMRKGLGNEGKNNKKSKAENEKEGSSNKNISGVYNRLGHEVNVIEKLIVRVETTIIKQNNYSQKADLEKIKDMDFSVDGLTEEEVFDIIDPETVANRILDFARNLANGDPAKLDMLENAVEEGFRQAANILGGLPEVSQKTYDIVKEGFQEMREEMMSEGMNV